MTTASNILQTVWRRLGQLDQFTATGGSTLTATTTALVGLYSDDDFKQGTLVVIKSTDGLAPNAEMQKISAYADDGTTQTFTVDTVFTAAIASGDVIGFVKGQFPKETMLSLLNDSLQKLDIVLQDTSVTTAASQTEYTLPVTLKNKEIVEVLVQTNTDDSDDNGYVPAAWWKQRPAAAGSTGILELAQYQSGLQVLLHYKAKHPALTAASSTLHETIDPELACAALKLEAANWLAAKQNTQKQTMLQFTAQNEYAGARAAFPIWQPKQRHKYLVVGDQ